MTGQKMIRSPGYHWHWCDGCGLSHPLPNEGWTFNGELRVQADRIASLLKAAERGEQIDVRYAERIEAARLSQTPFRVGIVMDDKVITIDLPWTTIRTTTEEGLSEYVLNQMRDARHATH